MNEIRMKLRFVLVAIALLTPSVTVAQTSATQCIANVAAQGTSDAITSAQLPCGTTANLVILTAAAANITTTPTYQPVGSPALKIVRPNGGVLAIGDLQPGYVALLSSTGSSWVLLNPYQTELVNSLSPGSTGILPKTNGGVLWDNNGVLADSTTLPSGLNLQTPSALGLANATGLPVAGISGLGTGIGAALAANVGNAGAPVLFNGVLGKPASGDGTNITNVNSQSLVSFPTTAISSQHTYGNSFTTCGYATCGDGGGATFGPAVAVPRSISNHLYDAGDLSVTSGSNLIASRTAAFNILDVGRTISDNLGYIPIGATIAANAQELSGVVPLVQGSGYGAADFQATITSGPSTLHVSQVNFGFLSTGQLLIATNTNNAWVIGAYTGSTPGGAGDYVLSGGAGLSTVTEEMTSGDTIVLNDGCDVHGNLIVRNVSPTGNILAADIYGQPSECTAAQKAALGTTVGVASTSGTGVSATFTPWFWASATYAYLSANATATSNFATDYISSIGSTAAETPGYATDADGLHVAMLSQAIDVRMFGAVAGGADSCLAVKTRYAAAYNTGWPLAPLWGIYNLACQVNVARDNSNSSFNETGLIQRNSGYNFTSANMPWPGIVYSIPDVWSQGVQQGDAGHADFTPTIMNLRFTGNAIGGPLLEIGSAYNLDATNNPLFNVNASNSSTDPLSIGILVSGLYTCGPFSCQFEAGGATNSPRNIADGVTTLNSTTLCSAGPTKVFTFADIGREISSGPFQSPSTIPAGTYVVDAPPDTATGCVKMSQAATGNATGMTVKFGYGYAAVVLQGVNATQDLWVQAGGFQNTQIVLRGYQTNATQRNLPMLLNAQDLAIESVRFADKLVRENDFWLYADDDYAVNAISGQQNVFYDPYLAVPASQTLWGAYDNGATAWTVDSNNTLKYSGVTDIAINPMVSEIPNASSTGTTLNKLAKLTGSPSTAVRIATTDTTAAIGVVVGGAGTTGNAQIVMTGTTSCVFDGATTAGDYVQASTTVAGDCHDTGGAYPTNNQVVGRVLSTNGGSGTYPMLVFPLEIGASGGGTVNVGTVNDLAYYASSTNTVSPRATANNGVLVTSATGVPSISSTIPPVTGADGGTWGTNGIFVGNIYYSIRVPSVNLNSTGDTAITINLPTGWTRYRVDKLWVLHASTSLTTAKVGLYTAASQGGTALLTTAQTALSPVTSTSENTAANDYSVPLTINISLNVATLYLNVGTAQGAPATADFIVAIYPMD